MADQVSGTSDWAAGNGFSYALRTNGLIALWGDNSSGQLAIPPTLLTGGGVAAIAAGEANALALKENGQIYAWGRTTYGATNIPTAATNMAAIAVGGNHCVALKSPGVPAMACQPWSQTIDASSNTVFTGIAVGFGSLRYQWRFNGTNIAGATNKWFGITNAQSSDAGSYILIVSNALGSSASVTSSIATLTVTSTAVPAAPIWSNAFFDNAGFHARLTGTPGNYVIESALTPVFVAPASITTNIPGVGYIDLLDGTATRAGNRYYRAYSQ